MTSALLEKLEKAECGSRELDAEIWLLVDPAAADRNMDNALERLAGNDAPEGPYAPHYTTSIDARLPSEDIEIVQRLSNGMWWAHDSRLPEGVGMVGHTEPLARRIAALAASLKARW